MKLVVITLSLLIASSASAVELKSSIAGGSGCSANSNLGASLNGNTIYWSVPGFDVKVEAHGSRLDRKNCNVTLIFQLPAGTKISPSSMKFDLQASIPESANGSFKVRTHYRGQKGDVASSIDLEGPSDRNGAGELNLNPDWSACGGEVALTIGTSINVKRGKEKAGASMKLKNFGRVQLKTESC